MIALLRWSGIVRFLLVPVGLALLFCAIPRAARADLDEYIKKPDSAFAWSQASSIATRAGVITSIKLTSQVWQGITWSHDLCVYEPREIVHPDAMLLLITGGHTGEQGQPRTMSKGSHWPSLRRAGRGAPPGPQPAAPRRQDRRHADRRDLRSLSRDEGQELAPSLPDGQERDPGHGRGAGLGQGPSGRRDHAIRRDRRLEAGLDHLAHRRG